MRLKKCLARQTYGLRTEWARTKEDCLEVWQYWRFRAKYSVKKGWRLRTLAWLLVMHDKLTRGRTNEP